MKRSFNNLRSPSVLPWLRTAIVIVAIVLMVETFLVLGIVTPVVIEGSSMAPTLLGPHVAVTCPHCECDFKVGTDQLPEAWPMVCPDCRESFHAPETGQVAPGRPVWVDRTRFESRQPRRFEVVVFRCPEHAMRLCVKRILGLPGELVSFSGGDLFVDGQIIRKNLAQQLALRQLLHREREPLLLWQAESDDWQRASGAWRHEGDAPARLEFHPAGGEPITDDLGTNQRATRRLIEVTDLMVTCEATLAPNASIEFQALFPGEAASAAKKWQTTGRAKLTWSLFDRQSMLAVNGKVEHRDRSTTPWPAPPRLAIVATGDVTLHDLTLWRDITYHTRPVDRWPAGAALPAGEFFVVGDNVAISSDSRNWGSPGLPGRLLVGAPLFDEAENQ